MKIALDYDDTFTREPHMWSSFVKLVQEVGHEIKFVTFRFEESATRSNVDIEHDAKQLGIDIVYCNYEQKSECYSADIWIDDMPILIPSIEAMKCAVMGSESAT